MSKSYLVYSDVHLGHRKTPIFKTIESLEKLWTNDWFKKLDVLFIAGDLYDRRLDFHSEDASSSILHLMRLGKICEKYNIALYILEGTPSHDWKQARIITDLYRQMGLKTPYYYIDSLEERYVPELGKNVLFIPDEIDTPANVYTMVRDLLGTRKTDIVIMHGAFIYQQSGAPEELCHIEDNYLRITNHLIHPGHIHQHTQYDRIIAQGSFDRYCHGDEGAKGCVLVKDFNNWVFIENKDAVIYKTIAITNRKIENIYKTIDKEVSNIPPNSYIRLKIRKGSQVPVIINDIRKNFPLYNFTYYMENKDDDGLVSKKLLDKKDDYGVQITPENINILVSEELKSLLTSNPSRITFSTIDHNKQENGSERNTDTLESMDRVISEHMSLLQELT